MTKGVRNVFPAAARSSLQGEPATVGAPPAIANAVVDALSHLGVTHVDIPITPEKVWQLLKKAGVAE